MSEQPSDAASDIRSETPADTTADTPAETTGLPEVDDVLADIAGVQERPLEEHPAAFEEAHDRLRRALDDAGTGTDRS